MVRSTAISWKIGLAVTALALQAGQLPALADDESAQEVETRSQPLEPTAVRVTLLPPASDTVISSWRPWPVEGATIIMVRPAENAAIAQPRPEQVEAAPIMVQPAGNAAIAQPRPEPVEAAPIPVQPAGNAAIVQPRPEPEKIQEDAARAETSSSPERRPRVALLPPVGNAIIASPRPEPAKTQNDAPSVAIPSLPGRSPFRQAPFKSEIVENGPNAAAAFRQQNPEPPKGTAASRFLANLWPGNKGAGAPVSSPAGGSPSSAGDGKAGSPGPSTASASAQGQAEAGQKSEKPPIKRLLDGIQFWKK